MTVIIPMLRPSLRAIIWAVLQLKFEELFSWHQCEAAVITYTRLPLFTARQFLALDGQKARLMSSLKAHCAALCMSRNYTIIYLNCKQKRYINVEGCGAYEWRHRVAKFVHVQTSGVCVMSVGFMSRRTFFKDNDSKLKKLFVKQGITKYYIMCIIGIIKLFGIPLNAP